MPYFIRSLTKTTPMVIYINPDCSKCNEAQAMLDAANCNYTVRNYLETPPSVADLNDLVKKLGCRAEDLVRKNEPVFLQNFSSKSFREDEWIGILAENPILLQRPIVIEGSRAVIGRPPVLIFDLIGKP